MHKNGNFVIYRGKLHLIFKIEQTSIGEIYYLLDVSEDSSDDVKIVTSQNIESYKSRPRNTRPSSDMTLSQERAICRIEQTLGLEFNGRSLYDVSKFISIFMQKSIEAQSFRDESRYIELSSSIDFEIETVYFSTEL